MAVIALSVVGASAAGDLVGYEATDHGGLLAILASLGHSVVEPADPAATHYVAMDHNRESFTAIAGHISVDCRQLVVFEPRVVLPDNYKASVRNGYGSILSMGAEGSVVGTAPLPWPQRDWRTSPGGAGQHHRGTTALINANKISMIRGSLYGLRRRVIDAFDAENLPLTLAGSSWSRRGRALLAHNATAVAYAAINGQAIDPREWARPLPLAGSVDNIGIVDDKQAVLASSEFAVVIENSANYVSEKLFDALVAGCVPLYVGPSLSALGIADGLAVQLGANARPRDFTSAVQKLTDSDKSKILGAGRDWLGEQSTWDRWAMPSALAQLARAIDSNIAAAPITAGKGQA